MKQTNSTPAIVIIGAGQLGSRHLQSLAETDFNLYVIDPSENSLKVAEERFNEVNACFTGSISFLQEITALPENIDVAIIATNSNVRAKVTESLLAHAKVRFIILEKVLFPRMQEYDRVGELLEMHGTKAWVNCPRRMFPVYQEIRETVINDRISFQVVGNNWGLGCNGIHMLDLFAFLTGVPEMELSGANLDQELLDSKRPGYVEFTGTLTGASERGDVVSITCNNSPSASPLLFVIASDKIHYVVQQHQGALKIDVARAENNWQWEQLSGQNELQSKLTIKVVNDLLENSDCELTSYSESALIHKAFLGSLSAHLSKIENKQVEECLIT